MKLHQKMSFIDLCLTFVIILQVSGCVNCKWCTRITSEKHTFTTNEPGQCLQSYKEGCGWFSFEQCTYYELVPCFKEVNHTVVQYKVVEECCPGYQLHPTRNDTCIVKSGFRQNYTVQYYKSEDDLLFGLSQGAIAGIICAILFLCCVIILISVHTVKRSLRRSAVKTDNGMEHDMVEKMLPAPQT